MVYILCTSQIETTSSIGLRYVVRGKNFLHQAQRLGRSGSSIVRHHQHRADTMVPKTNEVNFFQGSRTSDTRYHKQLTSQVLLLKGPSLNITRVRDQSYSIYPISSVIRQQPLLGKFYKVQSNEFHPLHEDILVHDAWNSTLLC